ncbi:MAG: hypothetical protein IJ685_04570 [Selenomonadaceae bacterium]|nr:hypothetical protein [Selenomonadaceae bacterium]
MVSKNTVVNMLKVFHDDMVDFVENFSASAIGGVTYSDFTGATSITGGLSGLVPAPSAGEENYFLRGDGTWASISGGGGVIYLSTPEQTGSLTYNGSEQSPAWLNYSSEQMAIGGTTAATEAGTYTTTFTPQGLCAWLDGTSNTKQVTWTIAKAALNLSATIDGAVGYGSTGTISVTGNAGNGEVTATSSNDTIVDVQSASTDSVTVQAAGVSNNDVTITINVAETTNYLAGSTTCAVSTEKGTCTMTLSETSGIVGLDDTATITVTTPSDGTLSVTSSDTEVATATISGNTVTVTGKGAGNAIITVSQAAGTNYNAPESQTFSATVQIVVGNTLNETSWSTISAVAKAGIGDTHWDIGDCKEVTLNGKIGNQLTLSNQKLCVFILHFNYALNGKADNNIIWSGFKTALTNGKDVALCDAKYGSSSIDGTICFNMNHTGQTNNGSGNGYYGTNYGGWKGADFRYDVLGATSTQPSGYGSAKTASCVGYNATDATLTSPKSNTLLAALPSDMRNALRLWSRWVDAKGNCSNVEANIEETIDAVTLLTEWEVQGARTYANDYEKNHQKQMDYYKNGNSKIKYRHDSTSSAVWWWVASRYYYYTRNFFILSTDGSASYRYAYYAGCLAPAFKV